MAAAKVVLFGFQGATVAWGHSLNTERCPAWVKICLFWDEQKFTHIFFSFFFHV
jgi:hypothetical protein